MQYTIQIVTKNRHSLLPATIKHLREHTKRDSKTRFLICDSSDNKLDENELNKLKEVAGDLTYFYKPELNLPQSRQYSIDHSEDDLFIQSDDDVTIKKGVLENLIEPLVSDDVIVQTGTILDTRYARYLAYKNRGAIFDAKYLHVLFASSKHKLKERNVSFDPRISVLEVYDFSFQIWENGGRVVYVPSVVCVQHDSIYNETISGGLKDVHLVALNGERLKKGKKLFEYYRNTKQVYIGMVGELLKQKYPDLRITKNGSIIMPINKLKMEKHKNIKSVEDYL
jgi:hypothetical protein